jgi:quercetin dioxygenase-like cupin family protein
MTCPLDWRTWTRELPAWLGAVAVTACLPQNPAAGDRQVYGQSHLGGASRQESTMTGWEGCKTSPVQTGESVDLMGMTFTFRLTGKDTNGKFSITDQYALPGAGPTWLHAHPAEETFIVVNGEFEVYGRENGTKVARRLGPGGIHHVGANAPHAVKNVGPTLGRILLLFHPADLQEGLFKDVGKPTTATSDPAPEQGPPTREMMAKLLSTFKKHKLELLEPLGP